MTKETKEKEIWYGTMIDAEEVSFILYALTVLDSVKRYILEGADNEEFLIKAARYIDDGEGKKEFKDLLSKLENVIGFNEE